MGRGNTFWRFLKNTILLQESEDLNRFLGKFSFQNVHFYICYLISFQVTTKNILHEKLPNCEGGTILKLFDV